jgi:transposase-like protein
MSKAMTEKREAVHALGRPERGGGERSEPQRSGGRPSAPVAGPDRPPDPQVEASPTRRRFTVEDKLRILREADRCKAPGAIGALLRREGLYSSILSAWRRQRDEGALAAGRGRKRGPKPRATDPKFKQLERENQRLQRRLAHAEAIIAVQKKVSEWLEITLPDPESVKPR